MPCADLAACTGRLQDALSGLHQRVWSSFVPRKEDVTEDYWEWLKWRLGQVRGSAAGRLLRWHSPQHSTARAQHATGT